MRIGHPHCGWIQPQPKQEEKSEPSASALRASAGEGSRTQDLAEFSEDFKGAVSTRSADGPSALPSALGDFQSGYKRKVVPMRLRPPAVRVSHPHWTRRRLKTARFGSFSIFSALWTRFDCLKYQCFPGKQSIQSIHYSTNT